LKWFVVKYICKLFAYIKREEQTGYRYKCTSNCLGRERSTAAPSNSMALARNDPRYV
jgi:hypothetical protein